MLRAPELTTMESILAPTVMTAPAPLGSDDEDDILDLTLIKDAVTSLHQEETAQFALLEDYTGARIADIVTDHSDFLNNQKRIYGGNLKSNRQKQLFEAMTEGYFRQSLARAGALRQRKIRQFQRETIEAQNREFLDRALAPDAVLNDGTLAVYRDLILLNLKTLYEDAHSDERAGALDAAARTLHEAVLAKRLEADPASAKDLASSQAVRRTLGDGAAREWQRRAARRVRDNELRRLALAMVDKRLTPSQARHWIQRKPPADRDSLQRHYDELRHERNKRDCLGHFLKLEAMWRELASRDFAVAALPAETGQGDPALDAAVRGFLAAREQNGGLPPAPRYRTLLEYAEAFCPRRAAERLADEDALYRFVGDLGGPDAPAFQAALRMLLGKATAADRAWIRDLAQAATVTDGDEADGAADREQRWLERFDTARRIRLEREGHEELTETEVREIITELTARSVNIN